MAHDYLGESLAGLAAREGTTVGALAAKLHRIRARVRVHYLVAEDPESPPTDRCVTVLTALSGRDRRRHRAADVDGHLLECDFCTRVARPLRERTVDDEVVIDVRVDPDIVRARQAARDLGVSVGFGRTHLTMLATAVSEVARNMVRFAGGRRITVRVVTDARVGVQVVARDAGPGIPDLDRAMTDGFSTYAGLGLGLAGARRLMDEFDIRTPAYAAQPAATTQPVTGTLPDGAAFTGALSNLRVERLSGGALQLVGIITGPGPLAGGTAFTAPINAVETDAPVCEVLSLDLGPLHLDVLGLVIDLNEVQLDITAVPGAGNLLGNLVCAVAGLLDGNSPAGGLAGLLNRLLRGLGLAA